MPCYRCGARQVDPDRGETPWKRGVRADRQVLICPECQASVDWRDDLDRCAGCGSVHLVRRLGEVECRDCGYVREPGDGATDLAAGSVAGGAASAKGRAPGGGDPGSSEAGSSEPGASEAGSSEPGANEAGSSDSPASLAEEVELALARVLRRGGRPARIG